jgi:excisionase family DNA binding protein
LNGDAFTLVDRLCTASRVGVFLIEEDPMSEPMTLLTIEEVAELLHYSIKTVYKKAARGEIPSIAISRRKRLFRRDTIMYWLVQHQMGDL